MKNRPAPTQYYRCPDTDLEIILSKESSTSYPCHTHAESGVIGYMLKGSLTLGLNAGPRLLKQDDIFVILPNQAHSLEAVQPYTLLSICLPLSLLHDNVIPDLQTRLQVFLSSMHDIALPDAFAAILPSACMLIRVEAGKKTATGKARKFAEFSKQLREQAGEIKSLDEMAHDAAMSKYHFIREFSRQTGLTPHQFLMQSRIRKASKQLNTTQKLADIALNAGFYDQSHFNRHFMKLFGMTPLQYQHAIHVLEQPLAECGHELGKEA